MGRYQEAATVFERIVAANPNLLIAHLGLVLAYIQLGRDSGRTGRSRRNHEDQPSLLRRFMAGPKGRGINQTRQEG
ncbi:MAG: tetratricopeptide repeat protein [Acidobacteriaceae bacterium]|nr:tetratricopeptide repeat protein [Acidobacteriaceae bacterium]MBV9499156.1 tetratricopeptide repeat protein [Acidobacteriaceae bacterium]